jgi:hypothetical protein
MNDTHGHISPDLLKQQRYARQLSCFLSPKLYVQKMGNAHGPVIPHACDKDLWRATVRTK